MISTRKFCAAALACLAVMGTTAQAENQSLGFRLTIHVMESKVFEAPGQEGRILGMENAKGTAVFDDGRLADKTYIAGYDLDKGIGSGNGYSVYTFVDGSSIIASFEATFNEDGVTGIYTVVGGTGAYEGVKGSGSFQDEQSEWEDAFLLTGKFDLVVP